MGVRFLQLFPVLQIFVLADRVAKQELLRYNTKIKLRKYCFVNDLNKIATVFSRRKI